MKVETPATVAGRIRRALDFVPAESLVIAPDCGMKYLRGRSPSPRCRRWPTAPRWCGGRSRVDKNRRCVARMSEAISGTAFPPVSAHAMSGADSRALFRERLC
jgi:hypothetical protein